MAGMAWMLVAGKISSKSLGVLARSCCCAATAEDTAGTALARPGPPVECQVLVSGLGFAWEGSVHPADQQQRPQGRSQQGRDTRGCQELV